MLDIDLAQKRFNRRMKERAKKNWHDITIIPSDSTGIDFKERPFFHRTRRFLRIGKMKGAV